MMPQRIITLPLALSLLLLLTFAVQAKEERKPLPPEVQANIHKLLNTGECRGCNLAGAVFTRANLAGAQLEGADLRGASFQLANLAGANLKKANLTGAHLGGADLYKADFSDADLSGAILTGAYQESIRLDRVRISPEIKVVERRFPGEEPSLPPVASPPPAQAQPQPRPAVSGAPPVQAAALSPAEKTTKEESSILGRIGGGGNKGGAPGDAQPAAGLDSVVAAPVVKEKEKTVPAMAPVQQSPASLPEKTIKDEKSFMGRMGSFFGGIFKKEPAADDAAQVKQTAAAPDETPKKPVVIAPVQEVVSRRRDVAATGKETAPAPVMVEKTKAPAAPAPAVSVAVKADPPAVTVKKAVKESTAALPAAEQQAAAREKTSPAAKPKKVDRSVLAKKKKCVGCDLSGMDLSGMDLEGADLERADLSGANLDRADLRAANLKGSRLRGASLKDARLQKADLYKADLGNADFSGAVLKDAVLDAAVLSGTVGLDLSGASRGE